MTESPGNSSPMDTSGVSSDSSEEAMPKERRSSRISSGKKYNFRDSSIITRIQSERKRSIPKQPKPKTKPPPLSKYRRKSANARERDRMKLMNDAFEDLKKVVPDYSSVCKDSKVTKMTTLRLAVNYIAALRAVLGYSDEKSLPLNDLDSVGDSGGSEVDSCRSPTSDSTEFSLGDECSLSDIAQGLQFVDNDMDFKHEFDDIADLESDS